MIQIMKMIKKLIAAAASAGIVSLSSTAPAFAAVNITFTGNGSGSNNAATITNSDTVVLNQTNDASINNTTDISTETGGNSADGNTTGNVTVDTGNASATSETTNAVNITTAVVGCDCPGDITLTATGNGGDSNQDFNIINTNDYTANQFNTASVTNTTNMDVDSGDNTADDNTNGEVKVTTGDATGVSTITNDPINDNYVAFGGNTDGEGDIMVTVTGNGSDSTTDVDLTFVNDIDFNQVNDADVLNSVDMDVESGGNSADDNTGGNVTIDTGKVDATVDVDNSVNFNYATADCCIADVTGTVSGNGSDSDNTVDYTDRQDVTANQFNDCGTGNAGGDCDTSVLVDGDSGDNTGDDNTTGEVKVETGSSTTRVDVDNVINDNAYNPPPSL